MQRSAHRKNAFHAPYGSHRSVVRKVWLRRELLPELKLHQNGWERKFGKSFPPYLFDKFRISVRIPTSAGSCQGIHPVMVVGYRIIDVADQ